MRKTKQQSLETRKRLLDAARQVFLDEGVGKASLEKIAGRAHLTRGALYWHFADKKSLLAEVQIDSLKPLIDVSINIFNLNDHLKDPLDLIRIALEIIFRTLLEYTMVLDAIKILAHGIDNIDPLVGYRVENNPILNQITSEIKKCYVRAYQNDLLIKGLTPTLATFETRIFIIGLIYYIISDVDVPPITFLDNAIRLHLEQKRLRS